MSNFNEINLVDGVTTNGDKTPASSAYFYYNGDYAISFYGDIGAATVEFVFLSERPNDTLYENPVSADWTFTSFPSLERFTFPVAAGFLIRVTGADGSTNFGINLIQLPS